MKSYSTVLALLPTVTKSMQCLARQPC